ncbi:MAG: ester cyclase [Pseudomonadota bacterium]
MTSTPSPYASIPDYIFGVTKEIWEDRRIDSLTQYYGPEIVVRSPASVVVGNRDVIAATLATLHEFPDRQLFGEDVIWCDAPNGHALSSHRLLSTATHTQAGVYGAPTGARLAYRIIADCHVADGQINDEWLVRDQGAIVRQLGLEPRDFARDLIAKEGGPEACVQPYTLATEVAGPYQGQGNDNSWGQRYAEILTRMMNAEFSVIPETYDRGAALSYPGGVEGVSFADADRFWLGLRASFPSATFTIHHMIGRDDQMMPPRAALRWSLVGRHDGWGTFGAPTGADVFVMGLSHAEFGSLTSGAPKLRREWTLFDETAVWKQILLSTGDL